MSDKAFPTGRDFPGGEQGKEFTQLERSVWLPLTSVGLRVTVGFLATYADLQGDGRGFSHLKLQKLLYYMQGFCLAKIGAPLFPEDIEAWQYGPVVREVWYDCKDFGADDLPIRELSGLYSRGILNDHQIATMRWVYSIRGWLTGTELVNRTHSESPWRKAWRDGHGGIISLSSMTRYFRRINS